MPNPYRLLSLGVLAALGLSVAHFAVSPRGKPEAAAPPPLLPAAHANPAEVSFQDTLRRGESLSQLLERTELAEADARALLEELQQYQDPRRLRPGSVISYEKSVATGDVRRMEMRLDADRTLNVQRDHGLWEGAVAEVPVRADTVVLAGEVESSLYAALLNGRASGLSTDERRMVADLLADRIFAWQVDFSRDLRAGDRFRILMERMVRPDGSARASRVLGVQFNIHDREHEAYLFRSPDGNEDYYARDGESLKRAFLRAPLEFRRISSAFNRARFHPILKIRRPHNGVDYAAAAGTPVRAVGDGVVKKAGWSGGYGNVLEIGHSRGYSSRYAHLRGFAKGVRPGVRVKQGDIVAYVGSTGLSTAPHLHYEFHVAGRPVDPKSIKHLTGEPVSGRYLREFARIVRTQIAAMSDTTRAVDLAARRSPAAPRAGAD